MKIFCDYHHAGLYHAIHKLFVERLGFELYRPIGLNWAETGIWQYSDMLAVQRQYLDMDGCNLDPAGYYTTFENSEMIPHRLVTMDQFNGMDWDVILGTVSQHELPFAYLQKKFKPKAKFVRLAGNSGEPFDWSLTRNLIDTTGLYPAPPTTNRVVIHQEFDRELFRYEPPQNHDYIKTYVNCFDESPHYQEYLQYRAALSSYRWKMHGHKGTDGFVCPVSKLAESMREASFIFHIKSHGEGYGHIIHNAFACGRPPLIMKKYYEGKMAEPLIEDNVTAICLDNYTVAQNAERIKAASDPEVHQMLCENAVKRFDELVSFEADAEKVRLFLERLF